MKNSIDIKKISNGIPKIIVPVVENTRHEIINEVKKLNNMDIDLIEWRADFFEDLLDINEVLNTLKDIKEVLDKPIIFTIRTKNEGGEQEIDEKFYTKLNKLIAESNYAEFIDVEIFMGENVSKENIINIHNAGAFVIGSNHDFHKTPDIVEMISRMEKIRESGSDIVKIAVMPNNRKDVLNLLTATEEMSSKYPDTPIISMSMGSLGSVSRITGEIFGSIMTFGTSGKESAPGQVPVDKLKKVLNIVHESMVE